MARPIKQGLDYFPMDCCLDDSAELFVMEEGAEGLGVLIVIWQVIYSNNGYFMPINDDLFLYVKKRVFADINLVKRVVSSAIKRGIFSEEMAEKEKILTSRGLQRRFFDASKRKKKVRVCTRYLLSDVNDCNNLVFVDINGEIVSGNATKERKVKERKVKERKVKEIVSETTTKNLETTADEFSSASISKSGFELTPEWRPAESILDRLESIGIPKSFSLDETPEFLTYWEGKIADLNVWNARYLKNIKWKWGMYGSAKSSESKPEPIPKNFYPSLETSRELAAVGIDMDYIESVIGGFRIYWGDSGQARASWNAVFIDYAKREHAKSFSSGIAEKSCRDMTLADEFNSDWAKH